MGLLEIDVLCPIYKGFEYLPRLLNGIMKQQNVKINNIVFPLTNTHDENYQKSLEFIKNHNIKYFIVEQNEFSHSLTREKAMREYCSSKVVIFLSQDVIIDENDSFFKLAESVANNKTVYNFGRQICRNNSIEKYIRNKNYPKTSYLVTKNDIGSNLDSFFSSDAFSAYNRDVFLEVGGYQGYDLMMNEDMLYSKIILEHGYTKAYVAEAYVEHSHKYTLKQLYKRYYESGKFFSEVKLFDGYSSTSSGFGLAMYVLKEALKKFHILVLLRWLPDMTARYIGMRRGLKCKK